MNLEGSLGFAKLCKLWQTCNAEHANQGALAVSTNRYHKKLGTAGVLCHGIQLDIYAVVELLSRGAYVLESLSANRN